MWPRRMAILPMAKTPIAIAPTAAAQMAKPTSARPFMAEEVSSFSAFVIFGVDSFQLHLIVKEAQRQNQARRQSSALRFASR
jgi:hypothetical protein